MDFPLLPPGHEWHNPKNYTPKEIGEGYRLLTKDEFKENAQGYKRNGKSILEHGSPVGKEISWSKNCIGDCITDTYRVPLDTPLPGGWRLWSGGTKPVEGDTFIETYLKNGILSNGLARQYRWSWKGSLDIIAYRPVEIKEVVLPPKICELPQCGISEYSPIDKTPHETKAVINKQTQMNTIESKIELPAVGSRWIIKNRDNTDSYELQVLATDEQGVAFKTDSKKVVVLDPKEWSQRIKAPIKSPKERRANQGINIVGYPSFWSRLAPPKLKWIAALVTFGVFTYPNMPYNAQQAISGVNGLVKQWFGI